MKVSASGQVKEMKRHGAKKPYLEQLCSEKNVMCFISGQKSFTLFTVRRKMLFELNYILQVF